MKLLLVEDEARMAEAVASLLRLEHYEVTVCRDGTAGLAAVLAGGQALIVLDVMLPGLSGFEIARQARAAGIRTPILMLTAKGELDDKVEGLDCGADDYLTKPFLTRELLARLRALARRAAPGEDSAAPAQDAGALRFGDLSLDTLSSTLRCTAGGQTVRLSEKEYRLLEYFLQNTVRLLSREQLAVRIWGYESDAEYNNVEVYLSFTRKKLAFIGSNVEIKAVRGLGYELRESHV